MTGSIFSFHNIVAVFDILIVATVLYWVMLMFKGTKAERMFWGMGVFVLVYFISQRVELLTLHWLLSNFLGSIVIFVIVVFQQDIRKALVQMSKPFITRDAVGGIRYIDEIVKAATAMSKAKKGGLIVIERSMDLSDMLGTGVELDSVVSRELLVSIFSVDSPLHDGAVVVRGGRIYKAACVLPLSESELPKALGTRHRAAIGLAEETDAVIVALSEETGEITLVEDDKFMAAISQEGLMTELNRLFSQGANDKSNIFPWKLQ